MGMFTFKWLGCILVILIHLSIICEPCSEDVLDYERYDKLPTNRKSKHVNKPSLNRLIEALPEVSINQFSVKNNPFLVDLMRLPVVLVTWNYTAPCEKAFQEIVKRNATPVEAVVNGISLCEHKLEACGFTVGFGSSPDENGEVTLDAMVMDGTTMDSGAVGALKKIKNAIGVAYRVMKNTAHALLVGEQATHFGKKMGFNLEPLESYHSFQENLNWQRNLKCQPNYWRNVAPDSTKSCGPYKLKHSTNLRIRLLNSDKNDASKQKPIRVFTHNGINYGKDEISKHSWPFGDEKLFMTDHDSISMIAIDKNGNIAVGSSSNGHSHKIPGRVGDSAVVGASAFADSAYGAAIATGNGDIIQRFSPSAMAVEKLRSGSNAYTAAHQVITRIVKAKPDFFGGIVVVTKGGEYAAACSGITAFPFTVMNLILKKPDTFWIQCTNTKGKKTKSLKSKKRNN